MPAPHPTPAQVAAIGRLMHDPQTIEIGVSRWQLWCLCSQVQLACRHPHNRGIPRDVAEALSRNILLDITEDDPVLRAIAEAGWDPAQDAKDVSPAPGEKWKCRRCGCTDDRPCPGGCYWVQQDLCSQCAGRGPLLVTAGRG